LNDREYERLALQEKEQFWFVAKRRMIMFYLHKYCKSKYGVIADIGCGTGYDLKYFREKISVDIAGIDISSKALSFALSNSNLLMQGDAQHLPLKNESLDILLSNDVLVSPGLDPVETVEEYRRILKVGGYLFMNLPSYKFLFSVHDLEVDNARRFNRVEVKRIFAQGWCIQDLVHWNGILLPLILFRRFVLSLFEHGKESDVVSVGNAGNRILNAFMNMDFFFAKRSMLPFGTSIFLVARKK